MLKFLIQLFSVIILGFFVFMLFFSLRSEGVIVEKSDDSDAQTIAAKIFNVRAKVENEYRDFTDSEKGYLTKLAEKLDKWGYEYNDDMGYGQATKNC